MRKTAVMCLIEEICVLDKLLSGMIKSGVSHEFDINELTCTHMYVYNMCVCLYVNKKVFLNKTHIKQGYDDQVMKM